MESQMNISQNDSEMFHARSDAAMEMNTDRQSMHDVEQGYFNAEKAVFEEMDDKVVKESIQECIIKPQA